MSGRRRAVLAASLAAALVLALPAVAWAHAALLRTSPSASGVLSGPPGRLILTYTEPIAPKLAIVSVTDVGGHRVTAGSPQRAATNANELVVPLRRVPEGWYLVFWRVISADGHPVRGAFTFAVGPSPGPAPQFVIPSTSETAATTQLLIARWIVFLSLMTAIGLFVLRTLIARPLLRLLPGSSLRAVSVALASALLVALVATPVYVVLATAQFTLRSAFSLGAIVPLVRASSFGRDFLDLELVTALFAVAAAVAIVLDRPERPQRSVAALLALVGALGAAAAALVVPGLAGHAAYTPPRGASLPLDWLHLAAGSIWIGGLLGLVAIWKTSGTFGRVATLAIVVPRFSRVAFASVFLLLGSGIGASVLHLPTLGSLWQTSYGKALVVKIVLLAAALLLAGVNLARTKPRLEAAGVRPGLGEGAAVLLRRLVTGEIVFVVGALFAAAVLTSLAPPSKALAQAGKASARVGPGPVTQVVNKNGYRLQFRVSPNRAALPNSFAVKISRGGKPVRGAEVVARFAMLDMEMGQQEYRLPERNPGVFARAAPALVMVGHWGLFYEITPPGKQPFTVLLLDRASG